MISTRQSSLGEGLRVEPPKHTKDQEDRETKEVPVSMAIPDPLKAELHNPLEWEKAEKPEVWRPMYV